MLNTVKYRSLYFLLSLAIIVPGLVALFLGPGLHWSIEFTGGASATATFKQPVAVAKVEQVVKSDLGYQQAVIQSTPDHRDFLITLPLDPDANAEQDRLQTALTKSVGQLDGLSFNTVSPQVGSETVRNGIIAVVFSIFGILAYIVWAFRGIRHAFRYALAAIIALGHDILMAFAVAGLVTTFLPNVTHLQLSTMFLVGLLTLLGYSINDTIVVFDRVRENLLRETGRDFSSTVNLSILETMGRSLNTSFTTLLAVLALLFLGPTSIQDFLFVMAVGIVTGTYSSIFTASMIVVTWETRSLGSLPFLGRRTAAVQPLVER